MTKRLFVKLQTPSVELPISATDASGASDKMIVGFRREDPKTASRLLDTYSKLTGDYLRLLLGQPLEGDVTEEDSETVEYSRESIEEKEGEISSLIASSIIYIKGASLAEVDDDGKETKLTIQDTRKAQPKEDFWEDEASCLAALLDMYLAAPPWKSSLSSGYQKTLLNIDTSGAKRKN